MCVLMFSKSPSPALFTTLSFVKVMHIRTTSTGSSLSDCKKSNLFTSQDGKVKAVKHPLSCQNRAFTVMRGHTGWSLKSESDAVERLEPEAKTLL